MKETYDIHEPADLVVVATDILAAVAGDRVVIALQGDLGAGKTTFVQQLAALVGVVEPVTSPTFTIMKQYPLTHDRFDQLVHIDAYRLEDESEAAPLRLRETLAQPRTISCIEWPEQAPEVLPADTIRLLITINPDQSRQVTINSPVSK